MKILIQNGHVLDPESKTEGIYDILVEEKKIVKVAEHITDAADKVIDAKGCFVMPGFIDLHVHLRDPGLEYKETLKTGGEMCIRDSDYYARALEQLTGKCVKEKIIYSFTMQKEIEV